MIPITLYVPVEALQELAHAIDALTTQLRQAADVERPELDTVSTFYENGKKVGTQKWMPTPQSCTCVKQNKSKPQADFEQDYELFTILEDFADKHDLEYEDVIKRIKEQNR